MQRAFMAANNLPFRPLAASEVSEELKANLRQVCAGCVCVCAVWEEGG